LFVTGTMNLHFFVTGQIGMKFGQKRHSENFPYGGDFAPID